jgi:hypothetical protein
MALPVFLALLKWPISYQKRRKTGTLETTWALVLGFTTSTIPPTSFGSRLMYTRSLIPGGLPLFQRLLRLRLSNISHISFQAAKPNSGLHIMTFSSRTSMQSPVPTSLHDSPGPSSCKSRVSSLPANAVLFNSVQQLMEKASRQQNTRQRFLLRNSF